MDMLIVVIVGVVIFVIARSFMQYEQDNLGSSDSTKTKSNAYENKNPQLDKEIAYNEADNREIEDEDTMQLEVGLVIALMAKLSKTDGKVCMLEQELIDFCFKDFSKPFSNSSQIETILKKIFEDEQKKDSGFEDLALEFYKINKYSYTKRLKVLQHLVNLAYIDKILSNSEEKMLKSISSLFKINNEDYEHAIKSFHEFYVQDQENLDIKEAYFILEASDSDTMNEIKSKYKSLVKKYHPDLLHSKGFEDDYVQDYTRKLQQINQAYEYVKQYRK